MKAKSVTKLRRKRSHINQMCQTKKFPEILHLAIYVVLVNIFSYMRNAGHKNPKYRYQTLVQARVTLTIFLRKDQTEGNKI